MENPFSWAYKTAYNVGVDIGGIFKGRTPEETAQFKLEIDKTNPVEEYITGPLGGIALKVGIVLAIALALVFYLDQKVRR